jgi:hypothetical protein
MLFLQIYSMVGSEKNQGMKNLWGLYLAVIYGTDNPNRLSATSFGQPSLKASMALEKEPSLTSNTSQIITLPQIGAATDIPALKALALSNEI